jgi:hypothetical protein
MTRHGSRALNVSARHLRAGTRRRRRRDTTASSCPKPVFGRCRGAPARRCRSSPAKRPRLDRVRPRSLDNRARWHGLRSGQGRTTNHYRTARAQHRVSHDNLDPHAFRSNSYVLPGYQEAALLRQICRSVPHTARDTAWHGQHVIGRARRAADLPSRSVIATAYRWERDIRLMVGK